MRKERLGGISVAKIKKNPQYIKPYNISSNVVDEILKIKRVEVCDSNRIILTKAYEDAISAPYCAVFLDIDGTLIDNSREKADNQIIQLLAQLTYRRVTVCFITGRGRSVRGMLYALAISILKYAKDVANIKLDWESFSHWYCITGSGTFLLFSKVASKTGFLFEEEKFIEESIIEQFNKDRERILKRTKEILFKNNSINDKTVMIQNEEASFRCVTSYEYEKNVSLITKCYEEINHMLSSEFSYISRLNVVKGIYINEAVFEIGVADKKVALDKFNNTYLGVDPNCILRIGDGGALGEIDYSFLNNARGFTVNSTQERIDVCLPVFEFMKPSDEQFVLTGTKATCYLLENLPIYPTLCVKIADEKNYVDQLALIEKKANIGSSKIMNYYSNMINWFDFFEEADYLTPKLYQIFDIQTGAVKFSDTEWHFLKQCTQNDFMEPIIQDRYSVDSNRINRPEYSYFMETNTGALFRGAKLYYQFMYQSKICSKKEMTQEIIKEWLDSFKDFRNLFTKQVKSFFNKKNKIYVNAVNRKLLIGGFDNIRNCLLILINLYIKQNVKENSPRGNQYDFLLHLEDENDDSISKASIIKLVKYLKSILICIYELIFSTDVNVQIIMNAIDDKFDSDLNLAYPRILENEDLSAFRNWRETDFVVENFAAVEMYFRKQIENQENAKFAFWGMPYGAIELPIIAQIVCDKYSISSSIHYVCLYGDYEKRHEKGRKAEYLFYADDYMQSVRFNKDVIHVLIDDNVTTAKTLELATQCLTYNKVFIHDIIVVRYLSLNRSEHIFGNKEDGQLNASAPQLNMFFNTISGLVRPSPYSKLFKFDLYKESDRLYEDELGVFDKSKEEILEYLIKNYGYSDDDKEKIANNIISEIYGTGADQQKRIDAFHKFTHARKKYGYLGGILNE